MNKNKKEVIERPLSPHSFWGAFFDNPGIQIMLFIYWIFRIPFMGMVVLLFIRCDLPIPDEIDNIILFVGLWIVLLVMGYSWMMTSVTNKENYFNIYDVIFWILLFIRIVFCYL